MIKNKIRELELLTSYLNEDEKKIIIKAINFSKIAHKDQTRKSGDPYIIHPIEVAKILTTINLDASAITAGLLHDTIEDTAISKEEITKMFGMQISELVEGLTKISKFDLKINKQKLGENYRKLILASSNDLRVILIKLADRLHNMRTINFIKDESKRINISIETLEIFSPLAQRLGMKEWQDELEDLAFQSINPDARKSIIDRLNYLNSNDENIVEAYQQSQYLKSIFSKARKNQ